MSNMPNRRTGADVKNKYVNLVKNKKLDTTSAGGVNPIKRYNATIIPTRKVNANAGAGNNIGPPKRPATMFPRTTAGVNAAAAATTTTAKPVGTVLKPRLTRKPVPVDRGDTRKMLAPVIPYTSKYCNTAYANVTTPVNASNNFAKNYTIDIPKKPCTAYARTFTIDKRDASNTGANFSKAYAHNNPENTRVTATYTRIFSNDKKELDKAIATFYPNPENPERNKPSIPVSTTYGHKQHGVTNSKAVPIDKTELAEATTVNAVKRDKTQTCSNTKSKFPNREKADPMSHRTTFTKTYASVKDKPSKTKKNNFKTDAVVKSKTSNIRKQLPSARKTITSDKANVATTSKKPPVREQKPTTFNARKTGGGAIPKRNANIQTLPVIVPNIKREKLEKVNVNYKGFSVDGIDAISSPKVVKDIKVKETPPIVTIDKKPPSVKSHILYRPSAFTEQRLLQKMRNFNNFEREEEPAARKIIKEKPLVNEPLLTLKSKPLRNSKDANVTDKFKNENNNTKKLATIDEDTSLLNRICGTKPPPRIIAPQAGMSSCKYCNRNFVDDRIERHENICKQLAIRKVQVYDSSKQRLKAVEEANNCEAVISSTEIKKPNYNWRRKHNDFISSIRQAKAVSEQLAQGKTLSEIPQPPPSVNPDYIQCPHCLRRFNEPAANRHIPKCEFMTHNRKPKAYLRK